MENIWQFVIDKAERPKSLKKGRLKGWVYRRVEEVREMSIRKEK